MQKTLALALLGALGGVASSLAQPVVSNPTRVSGANAIDPSGGRDITHVATGATAQATLEAFANFAAIQDFSGLTGNARDGAIFSFTDAQVPDVRFSFTSNPANISGSANLTNADYSSSASSSFRLLAGSNRIVTLRIDFGSYDTDTQSFSVAGVGAGVQAAGFTLNGNGIGRVNTSGITVKYYDATSTLLSSQALGDSTATSYYTGYEASVSQASIAWIEVNYQYNSSTAQAIGVDDLGFTHVSQIPEPATHALWLGLGSALLVCRRSPRRKY